MPTVPEPAASLLTESQQEANQNCKRALHAPTAATTLKAVKLSLKAAYVSFQQAVSTTVAADNRHDRWVGTVPPRNVHHLVLFL